MGASGEGFNDTVFGRGGSAGVVADVKVGVGRFPVDISRLVCVDV